MSEDLVKLFVNPPVVGLGPRGQQELEDRKQTMYMWSSCLFFIS